MIKGRKTTFDERIEIVRFCIENNNAYQLAAKEYNVSYQQVYNWVKKYNDKGYESLIDNRGRSKDSEILTETEKLQLQIKMLESKNKRLELECEFLKKLEELERRRI
jgi:transposase